MKNYVILLAGGVGKRMKADIPKQFLLVDGKPIIVYTIENFQKNAQIEELKSSLKITPETISRKFICFSTMILISTIWTGMACHRMKF